MSGGRPVANSEQICRCLLGALAASLRVYRFLPIFAAIPLCAPAFAGDYAWHCMMPDQVAKHQVTADNLVIGEIEILQQTGPLTHIPVIQASFVAQNTSPKDFHVAMEIVGSNDQGPVFAISVAPGFGGTVSPHSNQPATEAVFATAGELAQATKLCVRFMGDF